MTKIVIGLAGDSEKTHVIIADERGEHLASLEGASSAVRAGEAARSAEVIADLVARALQSADLTHVTPAVLCVGVSGAGREEERLMLWRELSRRELARDIVVQIDATAALDDAFGDASGILLIAGRGSIAYGRNDEGTQARCGGWGPIAGDEGGAVWIARRALGAVTASADGREPETMLTAALLEAVGARAVPDLIPWAGAATPGALGALASLVQTAAAAGDEAALRILRDAAAELIRLLPPIERELFPNGTRVHVALAGGLVARGSPLRALVTERLAADRPELQLLHEEIVPARGAVHGALRMLGANGTTRRFGALASQVRKGAR